MGLVCSSCGSVGWGAGLSLTGCMGGLSETPCSGDILTSAAEVAAVGIVLGPENQTPALPGSPGPSSEALPLLLLTSTPGIISLFPPWTKLSKIHAETAQLFKIHSMNLLPPPLTNTLKEQNWD